MATKIEKGQIEITTKENIDQAVEDSAIPLRKINFDSFLLINKKDIEDLPKYLRKDTEVYVLTIIKNEWEGNEDAFIIAYAKEDNGVYDTNEYLLKVQASNLADAIIAMCKECKDKTNDGKIKGKNWVK